MAQHINERLALVYFRYSLLETYRPDITYGIHKRNANTIRKSRKNISQFFQEHGSLERLDIPYIGARMKETIEIILKKGIDRYSRGVVKMAEEISAKENPETIFKI